MPGWVAIAPEANGDQLAGARRCRDSNPWALHQMARRHAHLSLDRPSHGMGAKAWLAATVGCAADSIITRRLSGLVVTWNASASRLLGYQPLEMIGHSLLR